VMETEVGGHALGVVEAAWRAEVEREGAWPNGIPNEGCQQHEGQRGANQGRPFSLRAAASTCCRRLAARAQLEGMLNRERRCAQRARPLL